MRRLALTVLVACSLMALASCGPSVDPVTGLRVDDVTTGWLDQGPLNGLNKLAPMISFSLTNTADAALPALQVNAVFRRAGETSEWGARFAPVSGSSGLQPGKSSPTMVLTSDLGYTGFDAVDEMLLNSQFVDANVDLFAKYGSKQWVSLGRFAVRRTLVAATRP
jgi:hypothetical protein